MIDRWDLREGALMEHLGVEQEDVVNLFHSNNRFVFAKSQLYNPHSTSLKMRKPTISNSANAQDRSSLPEKVAGDISSPFPHSPNWITALSSLAHFSVLVE